MLNRAAIAWRQATSADAEVIGPLNAQLSVEEGAAPVGDLDDYVRRVKDWLEHDRYRAAIAEIDGEVIAYTVWRNDDDYGDVFVRQFFVMQDHRGVGIGQHLFETAVEQFWPGQLLRLDVYDSNPRGGQFWERLGFVPYSRLMRRSPSPG